MIRKRSLIALDLDGTLLTDDKNISLETREYLKNLENEGHLVVLCSGRAIRSVKDYYDLIGLKKSPFIAYNGHYAANFNDPNFVPIVHKLNKDSITKAYRDLIDVGLVDSVMSENENTICIDKDDFFLFAFYNTENMRVLKGPLDETIKQDMFTFVMRLKYPNDETANRELINIVESENKSLKVRIWYEGEYAEFYTSGVSKSKTISEVAKEYNIDKDDIFVFGDADNDREMLTDYKNSFAMINGAPHLHKIANNVTKKDNNNNGVIEELKKYF